MPHLILEHSAELSNSNDFGKTTDDLFDAACAHPVFAANPKAVKVRTVACTNARSGITPETFAHLTVRMLAGRGTDAKAALAEAMLQILDRHLPDVGSLSVETVDMDTATYRKRAL